jgi:predicted amidophosphoribosyltransferase
MVKNISLPVDNQSVIRVKRTLSQTQRAKRQRLKSMASVFAVVEPAAIRNRHVVLLDDVITTGATMGGLCDAIATHQPRAISVVTLAAAQ